GPLTRPQNRRRRREWPLSELPKSLRESFRLACAMEWTAVQSISVGKRSVQVIVIQENRGLLIDMSGREGRFRSLTDYVQKLEEGIDSLPEAFVLYDADDRLLIANTQYAELYPTVAGLLRP